jgi:hypothetical protein
MCFSYLKFTLDFELIYKKHKHVYVLHGFVDADWTGDTVDRWSTTGYIFKVFNGVVSYTTKKQPSVSLSSTKAEYVAVSAALFEVLWLKAILYYLNLDVKGPIKLLEDNLGSISLAKTTESKRVKHIYIKYHIIRKKLLGKVICLMFVKIENQLADMKKKLSNTCFERNERV